MDSPKDDKAAPETRKVSRRSVMQAGLKAGPVLMTLPTVPAWATTNQSATSCGTNPDTESCRAQGYESSGLDEQDLFDDTTTTTTTGKGKGKGKNKDDQEDGVFLSSGNWLKKKP
jgi:hypothetical protein